MKIWILAILVVLFLATVNAQSPRTIDPLKVVYALNCGGTQGFKSEHGFEYQKDQYFRSAGTQVADYPDNHPGIPPEGIKYTKDKKLHQKERYSVQEWLDYDLPIPADGDYVLILMFSELNIMFTNQRVCHIYFGDSVVRPNHDTLKGGPKAQVPIYLPFSLKQGTVTYANNMFCEKAYDPSTKTLRLRFKKVSDNPKIDGIILFRGKLEETNFFHLDDLRNEWDKKFTSNRGKEQLRDMMMEHYMKNQRMKKHQRNDQDEHEEYEKEYIEVSEGSGGKGKIIGALILLGLVGICYYANSKSGSSYVDDQDEQDAGTKKSKRAGKVETKNTKEHSKEKESGGGTAAQVSKPKEDQQATKPKTAGSLEAEKSKLSKQQDQQADAGKGSSKQKQEDDADHEHDDDDGKNKKKKGGKAGKQK